MKKIINILIKRFTNKHGITNPNKILKDISRFAKPSEVPFPDELLKAAYQFHTRGILNRIIQYNLDWVWPYWVYKQYNPSDKSFIPRSFNITHINLTHRNWTAIGIPDYNELPIIDSRGLLTPFFDKWSIDAVILLKDGQSLIPSQLNDAKQYMTYENDILSIVTELQKDNIKLFSKASVECLDENVICKLQFKPQVLNKGLLIVTIRPYNPEGISFINKISVLNNEKLIIDEEHSIKFSIPFDKYYGSNYENGDVIKHVIKENKILIKKCNSGMLTAAACYNIDSYSDLDLHIRIPLTKSAMKKNKITGWKKSIENLCDIKIPDKKMKYIWDYSIKALILHSSDDVYPGPLTYKRFWFRDSVYILYSLLCAGLFERVEKAIEKFWKKQNSDGYFKSQNGEWDSNGQVIWIIKKYCEISGTSPKEEWKKYIIKGAKWIISKRLPKDESLHSGLMPAGFSAEHLGPNDYYYWDNFWSVEGLYSAANLMVLYKDEKKSSIFKKEAQDLSKSIRKTLELYTKKTGLNIIPASPYRRADSGAIGSIVAGYPLQLYSDDTTKLENTIKYLIENEFYDGAFFQNMIHSGINIYLTLQIAQILLRFKNKKYFDLIKKVRELSTSTATWPEAIHPITHGGCMGDGHHMWAAAEWILMIRNMFVREEKDSLILCSGIPNEWLKYHDIISFGPAPTTFGICSISIEVKKETIIICWQVEWSSKEKDLIISLTGYNDILNPKDNLIELNKLQ